MSPRSRGAISMLSIIVTWAALVGAVGYWQNQHKHRSTEPVLIHTGIEKRAKIVTDTYAPGELTRCYGQPPKGGVKCDPVPLPQPRPYIQTEAEMKEWCDRERGVYRGNGACTFKMFAHNASSEVKDVTITPEPFVTKAAATMPKPAKPMKLAEKIERCTGDAIRLCASDIPIRSKIVACLTAKRDQLSARCKPVFDGNGNVSSVAHKTPSRVIDGTKLRLKASKAPCDALKSMKSPHVDKRKSHRTATIAAPEEYHDGASQWSQYHPGPTQTDAGSSGGHGGAHGGHSHAGGHHHHSPPPHHTLC